jgi:hypothetical protein
MVLDEELDISTRLACLAQHITTGPLYGVSINILSGYSGYAGIDADRGVCSHSVLLVDVGSGQRARLTVP